MPEKPAPILRVEGSSPEHLNNFFFAKLLSFRRRGDKCPKRDPSPTALGAEDASKALSMESAYEHETDDEELRLDVATPDGMISIRSSSNESSPKLPPARPSPPTGGEFDWTAGLPEAAEPAAALRELGTEAFGTEECEPGKSGQIPHQIPRQIEREIERQIERQIHTVDVREESRLLEDLHQECMAMERCFFHSTHFSHMPEPILSIFHLSILFSRCFFLSLDPLLPYARAHSSHISPFNSFFEVFCSLTRPISPICQSPFFPYLTFQFCFFYMERQQLWLPSCAGCKVRKDPDEHPL